jgi:predicted nuclease with TOPRIM domain
MGLWDSVKAFFRREVADVSEGLSDLRDRLDEELTRRERELEATPSERMEMIQGEIDAADDRLAELEAELDARTGEDDQEPDQG